MLNKLVTPEVLQVTSNNFRKQWLTVVILVKHNNLLQYSKNDSAPTDAALCETPAHGPDQIRGTVAPRPASHPFSRVPEMELEPRPA